MVGANVVDKLAACDTESHLCFKDEKIKTMLCSEGTKLRLIVGGIDRKKDMARELVSKKGIPTDSDQVVSVDVHAGRHPGERGNDCGQKTKVSKFESSSKQSSWPKRREKCQRSGQVSFIASKGKQEEKKRQFMGGQNEGLLDFQWNSSKSKGSTWWIISSKWQCFTVRTSETIVEHRNLRL